MIMFALIITFLLGFSVSSVYSDLNTSNHSDKNINDVDNYDINILTKNNESYDIVAVFHTHVYKTTINEYVIKTMQPIFQVYPHLLRDSLERHIYSGDDNSEFFEMKYEPSKITLSFLLDLDYLKETIIIELFEFTQKTLEQNRRLDDMDNRIYKSSSEIYYLQRVEYDDGEDEFINSFKWDMASQKEREYYIKLAKEKYIWYHDCYVRIEPLVLMKMGNMCHIVGWMNISMDNIAIPEKANIYSDISRIIYSKDTFSYNHHIRVMLILKKNKLVYANVQNNKIIDRKSSKYEQYEIISAAGLKQNIYSNHKNKFFPIDARFFCDSITEL